MFQLVSWLVVLKDVTMVHVQVVLRDTSVAVELVAYTAENSASASVV